ncbi:hypothetical protein CC78DRAFT_586077 [Lojkania enalia]|uniref:RNA-dependent RNA polymerase n=1 Tax=Lojkania enalia TaxID=147567 RepID=A0A9P4JY66_9PLEO|nr:hypothetical protein CC78DRAFT_586077 [Didymosphaeria enalia]
MNNRSRPGLLHGPSARDHRIAAQSTTPHTGSPRSGATLEAMIHVLELIWRISLEIPKEYSSPSKLKALAAGRIRNSMQRMYWTNEPAFNNIYVQCLESGLHTPHMETSEERLNLLSNLICPETKPPRQTQTSKNDATTSARFPSSRELLQISKNRRDPVQGSVYRTTPELDSPTDEEDDFPMPGSPTLSIKSVQKQSRLSSLQNSLGPAGRKRFSLSEDKSSPKFTRTHQGKQPSEKLSFSEASKPHGEEPQSLFKKPSLEMARSFQGPSAKSSFNTSFNSNPMWSQQTRTQPGTANTSFSSEANDITSHLPNFSRISSTTTGSLDEQGLLKVTLSLEQSEVRRSNESPRESSPTFGSIDGDELIRTTTLYENENENENYVPHDPSRPPQPRIARPGTVNESPSRLPYRIREIPQQNLFVEDISEDLQSMPYFLLFICHRIAIEHNTTLQEVIHIVGSNSSDYDNIQQQIKSLLKEKKKHSILEPKSLWSSRTRSFEGYTFMGRVVFNNRRSEPVFSLELLPIQADLSCRFQRKFGADRFLYLAFPSFESGSGTPYNKKDMLGIQSKWKEWFCSEHAFLGRKWRAFHIRSEKSKGRRDKHTFDKRVILFATDGYDIDHPCSVGEMLNWFFPMERNGDQIFCKAFARIDLGLSKTVPTLIFKPSQIKYVNDILADGTPEDTQFNDSNLIWDSSYGERPVMNDGCSLISVGAAEEVWKIYKKTTGTNDPLPSAFQARIGGAKGMWMVSAESYSKDQKHRDIWIEITESQLKFKPHPEDESDENFDPHRLTFELCKYSSRPAPSDLHLSFIPIMVDRGVTKETIGGLMEKKLDFERDQLLSMLPNAVRMYHWVHKQNSREGQDIRWQAALPISLGDRVNLLLESGFNPVKAPYLANCLYRCIRQDQLTMEKKLRVPLGKATFLFGIADPLGVLRPGEIHVQFSTTFIDDMTNETYRGLDNLEVLVARQPACRPSDIQKVRAIVLHELSHLVDVVVFPSRGEFPLAGKLQGGDYDGDLFWLCWEPDLVRTFKNAPAPQHALRPEIYRIQKNSTKLRETMDIGELATIDGFLGEALSFRTRPSLLGMVTNFLEKQAYVENAVYSPTLNCLADIHDLLVDASKQGYMFSEVNFWQYVKNTLRLDRNLRVPAYKAAMEAAEKAREMGDVDKVRKKDHSANLENVLDFLYFQIIRKHNVATLDTVDERLSKKVDDDPALRYPYLERRAKQDAVIKAELDALEKGIQTIFGMWNVGMKQGRAIIADQYNSVVDGCYEKFRVLTPGNPDHPEIRAWLEPYLFEEFSLWDSIRASTLYTLYPERHAFVWHMAGRELASLKANSLPRSRMLSKNIHANIKPRPIRAPKEFEEEDSSDEELSTVPTTDES